MKEKEHAALLKRQLKSLRIKRAVLKRKVIRNDTIIFWIEQGHTEEKAIAITKEQAAR